MCDGMGSGGGMGSKFIDGTPGMDSKFTNGGPLGIGNIDDDGKGGASGPGWCMYVEGATDGGGGGGGGRGSVSC